MTRLPTAGAAELQFFFMKVIDVAYDATMYTFEHNFSHLTAIKDFPNAF